MPQSVFRPLVWARALYFVIAPVCQCPWLPSGVPAKHRHQQSARHLASPRSGCLRCNATAAGSPCPQFLDPAVAQSRRCAAAAAIAGCRGLGCGVAIVCGTIRSAMTPEEFQKFYPLLADWLRTTLAAHEGAAQTVASRGFLRLPLYFTAETLASTKVILIDRLPFPPLSSWGLTRFADFERGNLEGITYLDTFFLGRIHSRNEAMHFHELIHVIQWRILGPERFVHSYADGLEHFGYRQSPLEVMAYDAEAAFVTSTEGFDAEKMVAEKL